MTQTHSTSVSSLSYFPNLITPNLSLVLLTDVCFNWKKPILVSFRIYVLLASSQTFISISLLLKFVFLRI